MANDIPNAPAPQKTVRKTAEKASQVGIASPEEYKNRETGGTGDFGNAARSRNDLFRKAGEMNAQAGKLGATADDVQQSEAGDESGQPEQPVNTPGLPETGDQAKTNAGAPKGSTTPEPKKVPGGSAEGGDNTGANSGEGTGADAGAGPNDEEEEEESEDNDK